MRMGELLAYFAGAGAGAGAGFLLGPLVMWLADSHSARSAVSLPYLLRMMGSRRRAAFRPSVNAARMIAVAPTLAT